MSVASRLEFRRVTRAGWATTALFGLGAGALALWSALVLDALAARGVVAALGAGYVWFGWVAARVAASRPLVAQLDPDRLVIVHPPLLTDPLVVERPELLAAHVDVRPPAERRVAAGVRRGRAPSFLDARLPVVSPAPSSHSHEGTAGAPNVVLRFTHRRVLPAPAGSTGWAIRMLIRVAQGRSGVHHGPRPGEPSEGVRLVVETPERLALALAAWGVLESGGNGDPDADYLAPVTAADRERNRRRQLAVVGVVVATLAILAVVAMLTA